MIRPVLAMETAETAMVCGTVLGLAVLVTFALLSGTRMELEANGKNVKRSGYELMLALLAIVVLAGVAYRSWLDHVELRDRVLWRFPTQADTNAGGRR